MILTEEEARKKLCHKTLGPTVVSGEANYYPAACVASDCMAWRKIMDMRDASVDHGYCGLAGPVTP